MKIAILVEGATEKDSKIRDGARIFKNQDLMVSINQCPELKEFINTILKLCDGDLIS